jgi:hypothetical protein
MSSPCRSQSLVSRECSVIREYLYAEQLAAVAPWSVDAIEKMVRRGTFTRGVHYFQPHGRGTKLIFKWSAIVALIEDGAEPPTGEGHVVVHPPTGGIRRIDIDALQAALHGLVD